MSYVPKVEALVGGGSFYSNMPSIVTVNFDPTLAANDVWTKNLADGTLIIQNGEPGNNCTLACTAVLYIKACSDCDDPSIVRLSNPAPVSYAVNDAIALPLTGGNNVARITKGSIAAMTLAAPTGVPDGTTLTIISTTAFAHTVTQTTPGFNGGGAASDVATFAAAAGNNISLVAINSVWYVTNLTGVTLG